MRRDRCLSTLLIGLCSSTCAIGDDVAPCSGLASPGELAFTTSTVQTAASSSLRLPSVLRLTGVSSEDSVSSLASPADANLKSSAFSAIIHHNNPTTQQVTPETGQGDAIGVQTGAAPRTANPILKQLGYGAGNECTFAVASGAEDSDARLVGVFGNNPDLIASERKSYLADSSGYAQNNPIEAAALKDNIAKWQLVLSKCFKPAATSTAFGAMDAAHRLGHLRIDGTPTCLAYLVSKDHVLTARHCVYESSDLADAYQSGHASFQTIGDTGKAYRVCGATTAYPGRSKKLADEQLVLRIAAMPGPVGPARAVDADAIRPLLFLGALQMPTEAITFAWIPHASEFDKRYTNDLGVPSGPGCYVLRYDKGNACFTHFCPTYQGTSGGPMFTQASGAWSLLGVHIGVVKPLPPSPYDACTLNAKDTENSGVVVNAKSLAQ